MKMINITGMRFNKKITIIFKTMYKKAVLLTMNIVKQTFKRKKMFIFKLLKH